MPDDPYTPAELEAGAEAVAALYKLSVAERHDREIAAAALRAVLPDHDARVRADERTRVAEEIAEVADAYALRLHGTAAAVLRAGAHHAAAIVRFHATTPTTEEDPTDGH